MKASKLLFFVLIVAFFSTSAFSGWTEPVPVIEVNTSFEEWSPFLSFDGLTLYFARVRTSDSYYGRIFEATRNEPTGPFTNVREVPGMINSLLNGHVFCPWVSCDNLRMYYNTQEAGVGWRLWFSERKTASDPWPLGKEIPELNAVGKYIHMAKLTADERIIFFQGYDIPGDKGGHDIWMASRSDKSMPFQYIRNLTEINTSSEEAHPGISSDGLTLYFTSDRNGSEQLFKATRTSRDIPFSNIEHLSFFDTSNGNSAHADITSDGRTLYFIRSLNQGRAIQDIYVSYYLEEGESLENRLSTGILYEIIEKDDGNE